MNVLVVGSIMLTVMVVLPAMLSAVPQKLLCSVLNEKLSVVCPIEDDAIQNFEKNLEDTDLKKNRHRRTHVKTNDTIIYLPVKMEPNIQITEDLIKAEFRKSLTNPIAIGWFIGATHAAITVSYFDASSKQKVEFNADPKELILQFIVVTWNEFLANLENRKQVEAQKTDTSFEGRETGGIYVTYLKRPALARIRAQALKLHNEKRKLHGCSDLELDEQLNEDAQKYARKLAQTDSFFNSAQAESKEYSENIYRKVQKIEFDHDAITADAVIDYWYSGNETYNYNKPDPSTHKETSNFTAMIWNSSTKMGLGVVLNASFDEESDKKLYSVFVVARYQEAGNISGNYVDNVPSRINFASRAFSSLLNLVK